MQVNGKTVYLSASTAKTLLYDGPKAAHDGYWLFGGQKQKDTTSFRKGKLIDYLLFSGPKDAWRLKVLSFDGWYGPAKLARDMLLEEHGYYLVVLRKEVEEAQIVVNGIQRYCEDVGIAIDPQNAQRKLTWNDGVDCKAILDYHVPYSGLIIDLKTAYALTYQRALESCWQYRYDIQAACYREAVQSDPMLAMEIPPDVVFLFADSKDGHCLEVPMTETAMAVGNHEWQRAKGIWRHCTETNVWPETIEEVTEGMTDEEVRAN